MAKILIIDDDTYMSEMLCTLMKQMGHEAGLAPTLNDGFQMAASGDYDVVYLDVRLPDGSGLDLLPRLQQVKSSPEVIIITAFGDSGGAETAIKFGAWDYIEKASSISMLTLPLVRALQYRTEKKKNRTPVVLKRESILGNSPKMHLCMETLAQIAASDMSVLVVGETGTGKELFSRAIHENSARCNNEMVTIDCAALPPSLVEGVLFGHEKGAFTGADQTRDGLIKLAHRGTLFLDEVGELPLSVQKSFLRVLQEHRFRPIGSKKELESDFRVVAATNRDLDQMVKAGHFRKDLLYRLRSMALFLPPLREHTEDIQDIILWHMSKLSTRNCTKMKGFSPEFMEILEAYTWPGNVRELINALDQANAIAGNEPTLYSKHLPEHIRIHVTQTKFISSKQKEIRKTFSLATFREHRNAALQNTEAQYLKELMSETAGNVHKALALSGLSRPRLYALLKKHGISRLHKN
ncbi:MAG: sigma-54-dependent transcriptional regulator [Smithellaceae bacterium]